MIDILLHVLGAILIVAALAALFWIAGVPYGPAIAALINAVFWTVREAVQARQKVRYRNGTWLKPWRWSAQKIAEAVAPAVTGAGVAAAAAWWV